MLPIWPVLIIDLAMNVMMQQRLLANTVDFTSHDRPGRGNRPQGTQH
jgi:hypothetical protein